MVPENIHTPTREGNWKFQGGGDLIRPKFLKESMSLNWNSRGVEGSNQKDPPWGEYGYFLEQHNSRTLNKCNKITEVKCVVPEIIHTPTRERVTGNSKGRGS